MLSNANVKALLKVALDNQRRTVAWVLPTAGILFLLSLLSLLLLHWDQEKTQQTFDSRKFMMLKRMTISLVLVSTMLAFSAALAASQLARSLQHNSHSSSSLIVDTVVVEAGAGLQVLQWLAASFSIFFSTGISLILSDSEGNSDSSFMAKGPSSFDNTPEF